MCCCCVSGPRRAHADAGPRLRKAGEREREGELKVLCCAAACAVLVLRRRPRHSRRLSRALYTGLHAAAPHRTHRPPRPKPTNISRHHTALLSSSFSSVTTPNTINPTRRIANTPFPTLSIAPIHHPSSSTSPACPCPTHRPVTRPPPDSPRPRYSYNPSRASASSVNHLPSLSIARRHCAALHRRSTLLINHPIYRTVRQRLRVHSNNNQPSRHHSTIQQTIHRTPPMRALRSPNLWRIL